MKYMWNTLVTKLDWHAALETTNTQIARRFHLMDTSLNENTLKNDVQKFKPTEVPGAKLIERLTTDVCEMRERLDRVVDKVVAERQSCHTSRQVWRGRGWQRPGGT